MVQNFGFHTLPDGRTEVYHHGEYFRGSAPPFSLLVRLVFQLHARWVAWAAEHYINHLAFTSETLEEEELEVRERGGWVGGGGAASEGAAGGGQARRLPRERRPPTACAAPTSPPSEASPLPPREARLAAR
jgi:hypothetical protein